MDQPEGHHLTPPIISAVVVVTFFCAATTIICICLCIRRFRSRKAPTNSRDEYGRTCSLPIRVHGENTSVDLSNTVHNTQADVRLPPLRPLGQFSFFGKSGYHDPILTSSQLTRFTYKQLQKATKDFSTEIGKGGFGPVYKAFLPDLSIVAVKVLSNNSKQGEKEFLNEVMLLGRLHHRNLLKLVGYCVDGGHRILTYDFMSNGSLDARLHNDKCVILSWGQRVSIAKDIAKGIEYLHDGAVPPVIHRDIKSSNILLDSCMGAKVSDFGLSKVADPEVPASGVKGTYGYVDPEYMSTNSLTYKCDVYSFGVLLFELITARSPIEGLMDFVEMILMSNGGKEEWLQILDPRLNGDCNVNELGEMALIATMCTDKELSNRPRMQEVVHALSRLGAGSGTRTIFDLLQIPSSKMKARSFTKAMSLKR